MLCAESIVDGLHVSTHTDVRTYRDPVSHVNGSLLSGEEHVSVFLRILASGERRIRSVDLRRSTRHEHVNGCTDLAKGHSWSGRSRRCSAAASRDDMGISIMGAGARRAC